MRPATLWIEPEGGVRPERLWVQCRVLSGTGARLATSVAREAGGYGVPVHAFGELRVAIASADPASPVLPAVFGVELAEGGEARVPVELVAGGHLALRFPDVDPLATVVVANEHGRAAHLGLPPFDRAGGAGDLHAILCGEEPRREFAHARRLESLAPLAPGVYSIRVGSTSFEDWTGRFEIRAGETTELALPLERAR